MKLEIDQALMELSNWKHPSQEMIKIQLDYCSNVIAGSEEPERLEELNIGVIAAREINEQEILHSLLTKIQFQMQKKYLSYAAQVRLNIHAIKNT